MADLPSLADMYGREAGTPTYRIDQNMEEAQKALSMTPQERALYARHLANGWGTGGVDNPDGSRSSLFQANVEGPDGRSYNIPTVYDGAKLPVPQAIDRAAQQGWQNFPAYATPEAAEARYVDGMHPFMDKDAVAYNAVRHSPGLPPGVAALYQR